MRAVNFEGYLVYEDGVVIGKRSKKPVATPINDRGYRLVQIWDGGEVKTYTLHKLVALLFLGETPQGYEVDHIDDDKLNNHVSNLQFLTRAENIQKMWKKNGTDKISGFNSHCLRFTQEIFEEVLSLISQGLPNREILKRTTVKRGTLIKLRNGTHFYTR